MGSLSLEKTDFPSRDFVQAIYCLQVFIRPCEVPPIHTGKSTGAVIFQVLLRHPYCWLCSIPAICRGHCLAADSLTILIFASSFMMFPEPSLWAHVTDVSIRVGHFMTSCFLYLDQSCLSLMVTICCKYNFFDEGWGPYFSVGIHIQMGIIQL